MRKDATWPIPVAAQGSRVYVCTDCGRRFPPEMMWSLVRCIGCRTNAQRERRRKHAAHAGGVGQRREVRLARLDRLAAAVNRIAKGG
jgi:hypothetical protein